MKKKKTRTITDLNIMVLLIFKCIKIWFLKNILIVSQEKGLNNNFFLFCEFFISFNNEINKNFVFNKKKT